MTTTIDGRWHPGIGDPTVMGWITVAAYATTVAICVLCQRKVSEVPQRRFWACMALVMLLLGINKQLDLQTWFTELGRDFALEQGWYARRRAVQVMFIVWLILVAVVGWGWLRVRMRALDRYAKRAALGLLLLAVFVVVRAASFHHVDKLIGIRFDNVSVNVALELSGICFVCFAALSRLRSTQSK
jgi:hypothetical protein